MLKWVTCHRLIITLLSFFNLFVYIHSSKDDEYTQVLEVQIQVDANVQLSVKMAALVFVK